MDADRLFQSPRCPYIVGVSAHQPLGKGLVNLLTERWFGDAGTTAPRYRGVLGPVRGAAESG